MLATTPYTRLGLADIHAKVIAGERLSFDDGLRLFSCPDILAVGSLAFTARTMRHGMRAHFVRNRQINYSNICHTGCRFCAFARKENEDGAFTLTREEILARVADDNGMPFAEIHVVGGCNPTLPFSWFEETFRAIKELRPQTVLKAFTVTEVRHLARMENITDAEAFARLKNAGVAMITGGGGEIFNPSVRESICPGKISGEEYCRLGGIAHAAGLKSNCTMLFGHVEAHADRVDHLCKLREQQDASGGYVCFIPLAYQNRNNPLAAELEAATGRPPSGPETALDRLRTIAVSRLMLDNIEHIKAYWVMLGAKTAQVALYFGADDLDGTIEEEHIGRMAGASSGTVLENGGMTRSGLEHMIRKSGFEPVNRDALFRDLSATGQAEAAQANTAYPAQAYSPDSLAEAIHSAAEGRRLSWDQALALYREADLFTLGFLARSVRERLHPAPVVTYVADRNINYSNVCVCACRFCAFYRAPESQDAYVLSKADLAAKIEETIALGGTQILLQGGHHPDLPLSFYEDMIRWIRDTYPAIHIHAFSPPEIAFFAEHENIPTREVVTRLRAAGLASIPGGGAEVLSDRVRSRVSPNKCPTDQWLGIMTEAHDLGLKTTATMMFGHEETDVERLEHLFRLRGAQDESLENGKGSFTAFIPWTFQASNTLMRHIPPMPAPGYLRLLALSRLILDNFPNIQSSWVTMGPEIAQLALFFGANDFGSLMIEENVVAAANVRFRMNREAIHRVVEAAGFMPRQRLMDYTLV